MLATFHSLLKFLIVAITIIVISAKTKFCGGYIFAGVGLYVS